MIENTESLLIEQKQDMPEMPSYLKERNISNYGTTVLSTIIVVCALISLIINIKRKSTIRIILSIILPIIAIAISKWLKLSVLLNQMKNGIESSSLAFIVITISALVAILLTLIVMIFKKMKNK